MSYQQIRRDDAVILEPSVPAQAAVVWLHGLGADGFDFVPVVGELGVPPEAGVRFVFPHAPQRPVTINGGMRMRAWYDILALQLTGPEDEAGVRESGELAAGYLQAQIDQGIPAEKLVLAGFSQGGAITLHTATRFEQALAGVLALSTYLPIRDFLAAERSEANQHTPILMMHGRFDPVLPLQLGEMSRDLLKGLGYAVQWQDYPMQHQVCLEQIELIGGWLRERLSLA